MQVQVGNPRLQRFSRLPLEDLHRVGDHLLGVDIVGRVFSIGAPWPSRFSPRIEFYPLNIGICKEIYQLFGRRHMLGSRQSAGGIFRYSWAPAIVLPEESLPKYFGRCLDLAAVIA